MQAHTRPYACGSAAPRPCSILQAHISATGLRRPLPRRIQQLVHAPSASVGDQLQGLPPSLAKQLSEATASWVEHCLQHPLEDLQTNTKVYVLGTAHFCPNGLDEEILEEVFSVLRPNILAVELPFDTAARASLPYPPFVQLLCEHLEQQHVSSSLGLSLQGPSMRDLDAPPCDWSQLLNGSPQNMAMVTELLRCAMEARVGRDMFDPFEAYGLYPGLDFVRAPGQALTALQLFGYLPGAEYAHAVSLANAQGIQVSCLDAPLKLQEAWVTAMLSEFGVEEKDKPRQLARELASARSALPQLYEAWDMRLSQQAASLVGTNAIAPLLPAAAAMQTATNDSIVDTGSAAEASSSSHDGSSGNNKAERNAEVLMTAYKVSKAVAAGLLPYDTADSALSAQAWLQPLKYKHFARRSLHMARQLRDLGQRFAFTKLPTVVDDVSTLTDSRISSSSSSSSSSSTSPVPSSSATGSALGSRDVVTSSIDINSSSSSSSNGEALIVLAIVGRQYVHTIERLWSESGSPLWKGDVPRSFAPSSVPQFTPGEDPDVSRGGSRPVGQASKTMS